MSIFCYQCEQTSKGTGCQELSVCGKDERCAYLMDLLVYQAKCISRYAHRSAQLGERDREVDVYILEALFATVTNVDFDAERLRGHVQEGVQRLEQAKNTYETACQHAGQMPENLAPALGVPTDASVDEYVDLGRQVAIPVQVAKIGEDLTGLQELTLYGLKGAAAYLDHAVMLGADPADLFAGFHEGLDFLTRTDASAEELTAWALKAGEINLQVMELLDTSHTDTYGHPEPTAVRVTPVPGKAILVSGHDLKDLEELLKQTEGKGINVYTHGEMLPALAYPGLKKYPHLAGNYGGAWQDQQREFADFPGAILMTTNCLRSPRETYKGRIFTSGLVAWPGVPHIGPDRDFTPVIEAALEATGFRHVEPEQRITVGFGHHAVLGVADNVVEAVKAGDIRHFFLVGGCDGAEPGRNYYTELAQQIPDDCVILTLACGKFRFNKYLFGDIGGIPRLLDMGQCNDAYSAIKVAGALADAFDCEVNDLPLSLVLSWFEQKAVAILLSLLHLGIKNIRIGPKLPAFITPPVLQVLVDNFNVMPISSAEEDLRAILGTTAA